MRLGLNLTYTGARASFEVERSKRAEDLDYDTIWASETWRSDAVTVLSWVAARSKNIRIGSAILQIPARTPAMTAASLNELSGGRFILGLGTSGPQVAEGWHGSAFGKPLGRTREYISIVRTILARQGPLVHDGDHYQIPATGPGTTWPCRRTPESRLST